MCFSLKHINKIQLGVLMCVVSKVSYNCDFFFFFFNMLFLLPLMICHQCAHNISADDVEKQLSAKTLLLIQH